jgi:hypothetical protein
VRRVTHLRTRAIAHRSRERFAPHVHGHAQPAAEAKHLAQARLLSEGYGDVRLLACDDAETLLLEWLYAGRDEPRPLKYNHLSRRERNAEIIRRFRAGESAIVLAQEFGISDRRIRRLIQRYS